MHKTDTLGIKDRIKLYFKYFLAFIALILTFSLIRNIFRVYSTRSKVDQEKTRVEKLRAENDELKKRLDEAKSQESIEKELRDKLGLAKKDEIVVVLPDEETVRKLAPRIPEEESSLPDPIWKKWLKLFL